MISSFNQGIDFSVSALVFGHLNNDTKVWGMVRPHLNKLLHENNYFDSTPFTSVGLVFRYGTQNQLQVEFRDTNTYCKYLPVVLELDMKVLQWADKNNLGLLHAIFMIASLEALIQVAKKYTLPLEPLLEERARYGEIPNTIGECEARVSEKAEETYTKPLIH